LDFNQIITISKVNDFKLITPVLFVVFNRIDTTEQVFAEIRRAHPAQLFIAADGPRTNRPGETEKCDAVRRLILDRIDWPCEVKVRFLDENLGCRVAVSSAVDWFFSEVEEGIILEDDCLPHPDFFRFCQELLKHYRHDTRMMHISGVNFQYGQIRGNGSYYFSRYAHIWGWASWRRAWKYYDVEMKNYPEFKKSGLAESIFPECAIRKRWLKILDQIYEKSPIFNTWDFQWSYSLFQQNGLSIIPNRNLVSNLGCGCEGTNTDGSNCFARQPLREIGEINHPLFVIADVVADRFTFDKNFKYDIWSKIAKLISRIKHGMQFLR